MHPGREYVDRDELLQGLRNRRIALENRRCITVTQERERAFTVAGVAEAIVLVESLDIYET